MGELTLTAWIPSGKSATTSIWVLSTAARIVPSGLPMLVSSYTTEAGTSYKVNGSGWEPGGVIHVSVLSANGVINADVGQAVSRNDGTFSLTFSPASLWAGRADLGVRASTMDRVQSSLRYLPVSSLVKVAGTSGTYQCTGFNWPAGAQMQFVLHNTWGKVGDDVLKSVTIDANGAFNFTVDLPRIPGDAKNEIELKAVNSPYNAWFDY